MQPVARIAPDDGYVLCYGCGGVGICTNCEGNAKVDNKLCIICSGRRYCLFCKGTGQVRPPFFPDHNRVLRARSADECRLYFTVHARINGGSLARALDLGVACSISLARR